MFNCWLRVFQTNSALRATRLMCHLQTIRSTGGPPTARTGETHVHDVIRTPYDLASGGHKNAWELGEQDNVHD